MPTFGQYVAAKRAQYPNANTRWSLGEREQLADEVAAGWSWPRIAAAHGRTLAAVEKQAERDELERN